MDERIRMFFFLTFIVSKTYEINVSNSIQNPEILPVIGENITLACIFTPPSRYRQLFWMDWNNNILGVGCRNEQNVSDMSKYSLMTDSSTGNLTIRYLTVDDSGKYRCLVFTSNDTFTGGSVLKVLISGNVCLHYSIKLKRVVMCAKLQCK